MSANGEAPRSSPSTRQRVRVQPEQDLYPHLQEYDNDDDDAKAQAQAQAGLSQHRWSGAETWVAGLAPTYWSFVPLLIAQLHQLALIRGRLNCMVLWPSTKQKQNHDQHEQPQPQQQQQQPNDPKSRHSFHSNDSLPSPDCSFLPLSRCCLVGTIVAAEVKANGSMMNYVLDDGTGLIDCWYASSAAAAGGSWQQRQEIEMPWDELLRTTTIMTSAPASSSSSSTPNIRATNTPGSRDLILVGDQVQIWGHVKCFGVPSTRSSMTTTATATRMRIFRAAGQDWPAVPCIRQIHVAQIRLLSSPSLAFEQQHWWACHTWYDRALQSTSGNHRQHQQQSDNRHRRCSRAPHFGSPLLTARSILSLLGSDVAATLLNDDPDDDDTCMEMEDNSGNNSKHCKNGDKNEQQQRWRQLLFGRYCPCRRRHDPHQMAVIQDALMYCHCLATMEPLDPNYQYRDCLLCQLLEWESRQRQQQPSEEADTTTKNLCDAKQPQRKRQRVSLSSSSSSVAGFVDSRSALSTSRVLPCPLRFQFHDILSCLHLQQVAQQVLLPQQASAPYNDHNSSNTTTSNNSNSNICDYQRHQHQRLAIQTVAALRQDGILYLLDEDSDTYVLLSRQQVLEPYLESLAHKQQQQTNRNVIHVTWKRHDLPPCLQNVPSARIKVLQRMLASRLKDTSLIEQL